MIEYQKTWEVMNGLEEAFNKINTVEFMVDELNDAVSRNDTEQIAEISCTLMTYLPVYLSHYERHHDDMEQYCSQSSRK